MCSICHTNDEKFFSSAYLLLHHFETVSCFRFVFRLSLLAMWPHKLCYHVDLILQCLYSNRMMLCSTVQWWNILFYSYFFLYYLFIKDFVCKKYAKERKKLRILRSSNSSKKKTINQITPIKVELKWIHVISPPFFFFFFGGIYTPNRTNRQIVIVSSQQQTIGGIPKFFAAFIDLIT